tara:strand:- start:8405 stop:9736 length:1332 start_codon:yes stop_codon:yes gene_type:complete
MKRKKLLKVLLLSTVIVLSSCKKDSPTPIDPVDPVALADCNEVVGGTSLMDECGVCQQAYIYNVVTHDVTFLDDTSGVVAGNNEMLVMPDSPSSPYWSNVSMPAEFSFTADGYNTVSYGGQTARLDMASEMMSAIASTGTTADALMGMFAHDAGGMDFEDADLNASSKQIKSKTAAYSTSGVQMAIHASFDSWFIDYATNVAPIVGTTTMAAAGSAGMAGNRELNAKGMEYDQIAAKSLIGALCLDQVVNGYLSEGKIGDAVDNVTRDPNEDNNATAMEHHWDEGFGYVYGKFGPDNVSGDLDSDGLLGKYLNKYPEWNTIVFDAFKKGREAIVQNCSTVRDEQAQIIKETLSMVVAKRAQVYLDEAADNDDLSPDYFHALSEGYGFILSLQFTYTSDGTPYFSNAQVNSMLEQLEAGDGFWDRSDDELRAMADQIQAVTGLE